MVLMAFHLLNLHQARCLTTQLLCPASEPEVLEGWEECCPALCQSLHLPSNMLQVKVHN